MMPNRKIELTEQGCWGRLNKHGDRHMNRLRPYGIGGVTALSTQDGLEF